MVETRLHLRRPWTAPASLASNPVTSLRGALGAVLRRDRDVASLDGWLRKTASRHYPGQLPPRVGLHVRPRDARTWDVDLVLWGPGAHARVDALHALLTRAGAAGLLHRRERHPFDVSDGDVTATTAGAWTASRLAPLDVPSRVLLELVTPCDAPSYEPGELVGNLACALVKLDHATRDEDAWTKRSIDDRADGARDAARNAFAAVRVTRAMLDAAPRERRTSGETGEPIPLTGSVGFLTLEGALGEAMPWLMLTGLHGLGNHVAFGMGRVRLWYPSGPSV